MDRHEISAILNDIGMLLELKGESFFKSKAYYDTARALELLEEEPEILVREGRLRQLKGFGEALTKKITELVETGRLEYYEKLKAEIPAGLLDMLRIQGLGSKKVRVIYENLGISSVGELKYACLENRLVNLPGFGEKMQAKVLEGIENLGKYAGQYLFPFAALQADLLVKSLQGSGYVIRCSEAGSIRRKKEIVKDIDILASSSDNAAVMQFFTSHPFVAKIISSGDTKSSVTLLDGINADLRVVDDSVYPYALHHFTGSREHNTAMRHMAKQLGMKMNEYGLFRNEDELVVCNSEEEIFNTFGMQYIPPELRENNGELEAAAGMSLPRLATLEDMKGVIHVHSRYSDGADTIEELVKAAIKRGYSYLGLTDHSRAAFYAGGLKADDVVRQHEEIENLREKYPGFTVFKGIELEIFPDGSVDYDEEILSIFDFTIASVHSSFKTDADKMTDRVIKAMRNKHVDILGHPTGRLLLSREPYGINMGEIIKTASEEGVILEINANPHRLDLDWRYCKPAREAGCRFVISPDAHKADGLDDMIYGVNNARKGWLTAEDIVNALPAAEFLGALKRRRFK